MKKCALLFTLVLVGCGRDMSDSILKKDIDRTGEAGQERIVDVELETDVQTFEAEWGNKISFRVKISDLQEGRAGLCTKWSNGDRLAEIDLQFYQTSTSAQIEQVVLHELGHCALNREHNDNTFTFEKEVGPDSIMKSSSFGSQIVFFKDYRKHYINELFRR